MKKNTRITILLIGFTLLCLNFTSCVKNEPTESSTPTILTNNNPIDRLVQKLNSDTHGMWVNGLYPIIKLPANAKPKEVLAQAVKMSGFDKGHIKTYRIHEVRRVKLNAYSMENCSAILFESNLGTKILLFRYEEKTGWWTRFYDVSQKKLNQ